MSILIFPWLVKENCYTLDLTNLSVSLSNLYVLIPVHQDPSSFYNGFLLILIMILHMEGGQSPLNICPIPPLEEVLSELQVVLTLFKYHLGINAVDIVVARY